MEDNMENIAQSGIGSSDDAEMFDLAPVSLWLEDYSALKALFDAWRAEGVTDLRAHFAADPRAFTNARPASAC